MLYELLFDQLGRRQVSIWGSATASRHQEIEFLKKFEDFSIFATTAFFRGRQLRLWAPERFCHRARIDTRLAPFGRSHFTLSEKNTERSVTL